MPHHPMYASIVYWRRSRWNGARCEPVLMTLEQGLLRARTRDGGELFAVPSNQVTGRLSRLGTLRLTLGDRTYHLVGRGGAQSPSPTPDQRRRYDDFRAQRPAPTPHGRPGLLDQLLNGSAAWHMKSWRDALTAGGAGIAR